MAEIGEHRNFKIYISVYNIEFTCPCSSQFEINLFKKIKLNICTLLTVVISNWKCTRDSRVRARNFVLKFHKNFSA